MSDGTDETVDAAVARLENDPLIEQKRHEQKMERRIFRATLNEKLKDAEIALQNHLLDALGRKKKALEHVDTMDRMLTAYCPHLEAYLQTDPNEETKISNEMSMEELTEETNRGEHLRTRKFFRFAPKSVGNTLKLRSEILNDLGTFLERRESILIKAAQMPSQVTININLSQPDGDAEKPDVIDADYDVADDFKDVT